MAAPPLSHHDILELAAPFARHGLRVDLAASQRDERWLRFRAGDAPDEPTWLLEDGVAKGPRLTRTTPHPSGEAATLTAQGRDLATLLAQMQALPVQRHITEPTGAVVLRHFTLDGAGQPLLTRGVVRLPGLRLEMKVPAAAGLAASLELQVLAGSPRPALPEDLLAVLGWNWTRLVPTKQGWNSRLRLRARRPPQRSERAEAALAMVADHLARTLGAPPAAYDARLRGARRAVFFRRGIPTFTALGLVAAVLLSAAVGFQPTTLQTVLLYHVPTVLVAVSFALQELPRFEIPPWPRPLAADAW